MQINIENCIRFPHLLKSRLLLGLPNEVKRRFLNACCVKTFSEPAIFIEQGQLSLGIFLIAHGGAEVSRINLSGQSTFMFQSVTGNCLGEIEAIAQKDCIASCTAKKDSILLFLPTKSLLDFIVYPEFVKNLSLIFLERMEYNNSFRSIDKLDPVDIRLRAYLHFMSDTDAKIDKSQTNLAAIICCSRQTMNKELGKLRAANIVDLQNGAVIVLDRERLAEGIDRP